MSQHSSLQTLIDLAQKEADQLAVHLGTAVRAHQENQQKLALLMQYREDYAQRYQQGLGNGLGISHHVNFREFIYRLDEAIDGQKLLVRQAEIQAETRRDAWQDAERKRLSYGALMQRAQQQQQRSAARREQKDNDESANRMMLSRAHESKQTVAQDE